MDNQNLDLINPLVDRCMNLLGDSKEDLEKICWMVVHQHHHGVMPVEYDIREIDESLYLAVLKDIKANLSQ